MSDWRTVPDAITFPVAAEGPALHVPAFEHDLPLGFARCLRCRRVIKLADRLLPCDGPAA